MKLSIKDLKDWEVLEPSRIVKIGPSSGEYAIVIGSSAKVFSIAHVGNWIGPQHFQKYKEIYFKNSLDQRAKHDFCQLLKKLKKDKWGEEQIQVAKNFIQYWENFYLKEEKADFWTYMIALFEEFYPHDLEELSRMYQFAIPIYERSLYLAGMTFYYSVKNGIYDGKTLGEIYLVSLLLDCGLSHELFHYNIYSALEHDRMGKSGKEFLEQAGHNSRDVDFYLNHPMLSFKYCQENLKNYIENDRILELIKIHHEINAHAFPNALTRGECDEVEQIIAITNMALPYTETENYNLKKIIQEMNDLKQKFKLGHLKKIAA